MTDKQPEALKWADAVECAHMPQLAQFLRTQHTEIEDLRAAITTTAEALARKDALLRQALDALENSRSLEPVDADWVKGKRHSIISAITSELSQ